VEKTRRAWAKLRTREFKLAKRAGADNNRLEKMQARNQWASVVAVMDMSTTIAVPRLNSLLALLLGTGGQQRDVSAAERIEFFELLMFALVVARPCRPCTFYSADLTDWATAECDAAGNRVWIVTNIKTRDVYSHDALIVPSAFVTYVDAYVTHIRPAFVAAFHFRKRTPQQTDAQLQHSKGLFVGPNGRRYERFQALPNVTKKLLGVKINVTDWRKIVATAADDMLTPEDVKVLSLSDTHSELTVKRYYAKKNAKLNVAKAIAIAATLYDTLKGKAAAPVAVSTPASATSSASSSSASSSSSSSSSAAAASASASASARSGMEGISPLVLGSSASATTAQSSAAAAPAAPSTSSTSSAMPTVSNADFLRLFNRRGMSFRALSSTRPHAI
jgi:hypothetical protein